MRPILGRTVSAWGVPRVAPSTVPPPSEGRGAPAAPPRPPRPPPPPHDGGCHGGASGSDATGIPPEGTGSDPEAHRFGDEPGTGDESDGEAGGPPGTRVSSLEEHEGDDGGGGKQQRRIDLDG